MPQMNPNYPQMTSSVNEHITEPLIEKYGCQNVIWPIVLMSDSTIHSYLYEVNDICTINSIDNNRPESATGIQSVFIDYTAKPREIIPLNEGLIEIIDEKFSNSYEAILSSKTFNSADLDYIWLTENGWKGMEFTTFYKSFFNRGEAERIIKMMNRRPSWQGKNGPHAIRMLISAAIDLGVSYWMICVNTKGVSNDIVVDGNAYGFPLNNENVDRLIKGQIPLDAKFGPFKKLIDWL